MKFAYADPPYLGCGKLYKEHPESLIWDSLDTHKSLVERLCDEYPDGWAMSLHEPSLHLIRPLCPNDSRTAVWVKPFAVFKPNVNPAYAWEPVIFRGGRKRTRKDPTIRDWHSENITMQKGLCGAKPPGFSLWIAHLLGADADKGDTIDDLFPGTGGMLSVWNKHGLTAILETQSC